VAADLPPQVASALHAWATGSAAADARLRPVARESLHITLCFLGATPGDRLDEIGAAALACAAPGRGLSIERGAWLPSRSRARLAVADLADATGELAALQARVGEAMTRVAGHEREARAFRPHVTVLRVRGRERFRGPELPAPPELSFAAGALTLYRSRPAQGGSVYEPLARVAL
jgi:2'-5' RNA ligase